MNVWQYLQDAYSFLLKYRRYVWIYVGLAVFNEVITQVTHRYQHLFFGQSVIGLFFVFILEVYLFALPVFVVNKKEKHVVTWRIFLSTIRDTARRLFWPLFLLGSAVIGQTVVYLFITKDTSLLDSGPDAYFGFFPAKALSNILLALILGLFIFQKPIFALERKGFWRSLWMSVTAYKKHWKFILPMSLLIGFCNGAESLFIPTYNYFLRIPLAFIEAFVTMVISVAIIRYFEKKFSLAIIKPKEEEKKSTSVVYQRIGAFLIDILILFGVFHFLSYHFGVHTVDHIGGEYNDNYKLTGIVAFLYMLFVMSYYVLLEWHWQGTVGKKLVGIHVTTLDGKRIKFWQALVRNVFCIVDGFPYFIPYLIGIIVIAGSEKKQRLGDRVARTLVVRSKQ